MSPTKKKIRTSKKYVESLNVVMVPPKHTVITWKMDDMLLGFEVIFSGCYVGGVDSVTVMLNQLGSQK